MSKNKERSERPTRPLGELDNPNKWQSSIEPIRPSFLLGRWQVALVNGVWVKGYWYAHTLRGAKRIAQRKLAAERRALKDLAERRRVAGRGGAGQ